MLRVALELQAEPTRKWPVHDRSILHELPSDTAFAKLLMGTRRYHFAGGIAVLLLLAIALWGTVGALQQTATRPIADARPRQVLAPPKGGSTESSPPWVPLAQALPGNHPSGINEPSPMVDCALPLDIRSDAVAFEMTDFGISQIPISYETSTVAAHTSARRITLVESETDSTTFEIVMTANGPSCVVVSGRPEPWVISGEVTPYQSDVQVSVCGHWALVEDDGSFIDVVYSPEWCDVVALASGTDGTAVRSQTLRVSRPEGGEVNVQLTLE